MPEHRCTVSGQPADPKAHAGAPTDDKRPDGQYADHYVLCAEDRAKGYVEPLRMDYIHVGTPGPTFDLLDLTDEQKEMLGETDWIKFEPYPEGHKGSARGQYWSQADLDKVGKGCGQVTSMPRACAETYAAQPGYYGSTFCCGCGDYFPVGERGEFIWNDGTKQRVGTRKDRG